MPFDFWVLLTKLTRLAIINIKIGFDLEENMLWNNSRILFCHTIEFRQSAIPV